MTKTDALALIRRAHDAVKEHPFRLNFSAEYERDYNEKLWELSDAWCKLIYHADLPDDEKVFLMRFDGWIHNYNASLLGHSVHRYLMPYYESILQMTHRYLDTGVIDAYYYLERKGILWETMKFYLVTKDVCGIDSPELPRFFPCGQKLSESKEAVRSYIGKRFYNKTPDKIDELFAVWENDLLPVIRWHNEHIAADCKETAPLYRAI